MHDFNAWDSVIREFEIIGEATNNLIKNSILDEPNRVGADFRNLLVHNYFGIDPKEVLDVVKNDLPLFKEIINKKLNQIESDLKIELVEIYTEQNSYIEFVVKELEQVRKR